MTHPFSDPLAPPDVRFYTPGDEVTQFLTGCGEAGRDAYRDLQVADLFYPAVSGLFLASALALVLSRLSRPGSAVIALAALPFLGSAFDYHTPDQAKLKKDKRNKMLIGWGILAVPTGIVTAEMTAQRLGTRANLRCSACGAAGHDSDASYCRKCGAPLA